VDVFFVLKISYLIELSADLDGFTLFLFATEALAGFRSLFAFGCRPDCDQDLKPCRAREYESHNPTSPVFLF
tara:strand:+ start:246 stop:461 length:216 start_codon:yes stop_codon:yes gene_type:complete